MEYIELVTGIVGSLLSALLGAIATYALQRRRASDRSVLELWRSAFDRSAFKGPYLWHSDQRKFKEAIELTIQCVNTGVLQNRKGTVLGTAKPKALIKKSEWRAAGDAVERRLNRIRQLIPQSGLPEGSPTVEEIDREPNEIIDSLNSIWKRVRLPVLPKPTEAETLEDVYEE